MDAPTVKKTIILYLLSIDPLFVTYIFVMGGGFFMSSNINHSGFTSKAYGKNKRKYTTRNFSRNYGRKSLPQKEYSGSMLTKMGICALLAGLVLLGEFAQRPDLTMVSSDVNSNSNEQDIGGEYLGKLRFVELPGIIQVFSSDAKTAALPI